MAKIEDYLKSYGVDPNARYSNTKTTATANTTKTTSSASSSSSKKKSNNNLYGGYSSLNELKAANQARYNAATANSQSIGDYLSSNGASGTGGSYKSGNESGSTGGTAGGNTGTKSYSEMTADELNNERLYLNSLINGNDAGTSEWAKNQLQMLNTTPTQNNTGNNVATSANVQTIDGLLEKAGITLPETKIQNPYEEYARVLSENQAYIKEQQAKANQAAVNSGIERLNNQLEDTNKSYDNAARQAYINAMQAQYALPNQLAAMGYTGGMSETEMARARANYQNNMADIELQRANAEREIYAAINELRNTADQRTAEENIALTQEYINKLLQLKLQANQYNTESEAKELDQWKQIAGMYADDYTAEIQRLQADNADGKNDAKIAYLMELRRQKIASQDETETKATQQRVENALNLWKMYGVATREIADILGVPEGAKTSDYQNVISQIANRNKTSSGGGSSGGTKGTSTSTLNTIVNNVQKMLSETEKIFDGDITRAKYSEPDVIAYVLSQNIPTEEKMSIIQNFGLTKYME